MLVGQGLPWHTVHMKGTGMPSRGLCSMKEGGKALHRWLVQDIKEALWGLGRVISGASVRGI